MSLLNDRLVLSAAEGPEAARNLASNRRVALAAILEGELPKRVTRGGIHVNRLDPLSICLAFRNDYSSTHRNLQAKNV